MTQQTESTRNKISFILEQVGMSDEELYQLLYGRKQQVEIDIRLPQLMDEEIWQANEHSEEELGSIESKISTVEMLLDSSMDSTAIAQLESLLEGEAIADDARGLLLKKRFPNWRKGISQFLAFLQFSALTKLAITMATLTANHLIPKFENAKNRPQDRRMLSDFILQQLEQPSPPMIAALAAAGGVLSHTGELVFIQPVTAAIIALDGDKLKKLQTALENNQDPEKTYYASVDEHSDKDKTLKQTQKATSVLNKLFLLDRVEDVIANQQALQPPPQQQQPDINNPQQVAQQEAPRRRGSSGRRQREAQERQEREAQEQRARIEVDNPQPSPRSFQRFVNRAQPQPVQPPPITPPPQNTNPQPPQQSQRNTAATIPNVPPSKTTSIPTDKPIPQPMTSIPNLREKTVSTEDHQHQKMSEMFANLPLDALKGLKMENVDYNNLGQKKASVAKDNPVSTQAKPTTQQER